MKQLLVLSFLFLGSLASLAQAGSLEDVQELAKQCAVVKISRAGAVSDPVIECDLIRADESGDLWFRTRSGNYRVHLEASELSDGNDLGHVFLYDEQGHEVARLENVPAYGKALLGIFAGRWQEYRREYTAY